MRGDKDGARMRESRSPLKVWVNDTTVEGSGNWFQVIKTPRTVIDLADPSCLSGLSMRPLNPCYEAASIFVCENFNAEP